MFSVNPQSFPFQESDKVDLAVRLSLGEYMGKQKINIQVKEIKFSSLNDEDVILSNQCYEDFCAGNELSEGAVQKINVTRDFCGEVYRFMRVHNKWRYSAETLCYRLGLTAEKIADCQIALDILVELGFIEFNKDFYSVCVDCAKNPIENSEIFRKAQAIKENK